MINFVGVLTKLLMVEASVLLLMLVKACFEVVIKAKGNVDKKSELKRFLQTEILDKILVEKEYSLIYKMIVVVYGIMKLTAIWWFTALASVILDFTLAQVILVMLIEICIIGVSINNKLAIKEEKIINYLWLENKINKMLQKTKKDITVKSITESIRVKIAKIRNTIVSGASSK